MSVVEFVGEGVELTQRQRWSHLLTILLGIVSIVVGIGLRDRALNATQRYVDSQAGIEAEYPLGWLLDTGADYIFRVRDMAAAGFKTTIQVSVQPVSTEMTENDVLTSISLRRSQVLTAYNPVAPESFVMPNEEIAVAARHAFVATDLNPFLESVPVVVLGIDILTIKGGQVLVVTFRASAELYDEFFPIFERFLGDLIF